jgi:hypothetical protein
MRSLLLAAYLATPLTAQLDPYTAFINERAQVQLKARREAIAAIQSPAALEQRRAEVRAKIERLIGGYVTYNGPLRPKFYGRVARPEFTVEKVAFESLPNYWITANLYLPKSPGKHPAVLFSMGHWDEGKYAGQRICANLAAKGFVVLAYDPVGQGERLQAYSPLTGRSLLGGSTEQHFANGAQALLAGQTLGRYFLHDSKRALDYLASRPEVDAKRLGATGCSGGGTQTTYIAALDDRIQVAAPACYMNSFEYLIPGPTGDSEQSWPGFVSEGLDQSDWTLLFAPKPWLIASTEQDFFTPAGAEVVFQQAKHFYRILGKESQVDWVVGPGGHGTPLKVREAIYAWMIRWLRNGQGDAKEAFTGALSLEELSLAPPAGLNQRSLQSIILEDFQRRKVQRNPKALIALDTPPTGLTRTEWLYRNTNARDAFVVIHDSPAARNRALVLAGLKENVLLVTLPAHPTTAQERSLLSGPWIHHTRAWLTGASLPALRASDLLHIIKPLFQEFDKVYLHAWGTGGIPALYAAHAEPRIAKVWLERLPLSLDLALRSQVHKHLHEAIVPGLALAGDFADFIDPRFFLVDTTDWNENILRNPGPPHYRRPLDQSDEELLSVFRKHELHRGGAHR